MQPLWRQDLLRRVVVAEADDQACNEVLELLLHENGLAPAAPKAIPLAKADLPADVASDAEVLFAIGECSNVNAIDSKEPLTFEPSGITVVYGETGAGKSSYTRVLKRVARAVHQEEVLPNVFAGQAGAPRAVIDFENANGRTKHIVPLERGHTLLSSMTVFDGACARAYLTKAKTLEFTPTTLQIFGRAATAQRRIRDLLDDRTASLRSRCPSLEAIPEGTAVRSALEMRPSGTTEADLRELAGLGPDDINRLAKLKLELASAEAGTVEAQARQREREASALDQLAARLESIATALSAEQEERLRTAQVRVKAAEKAVENARRAFANEPLPESGGDGWLGMWEAARTFMESDCGHSFPPTLEGDICPLCQQKLSDDARERLVRFESFVKGTVEEELAAARTELEGAIRASTAAPVIEEAVGSPALQTLADEAPEVASLLIEWLAVAEKRAARFLAGASVLPALGACPSPTVRQLAEAQKLAAKRVQDSVDPVNQATTRRAVAELEARRKLSERLDEMLDWLKTLRTAETLEGLRRELDTTGLSSKQSELAKVVVTDQLRRSVRSELDALGFGHLKVDLTCRTERGQTIARIGLDGAGQPVASVLSDGEQRGCALAFFLAEALASPSEGGIVFDDPASSLDIDRMEHIAQRFADLSEKRKQLVVFTHNLVFAWCLQATAEMRDVPFAVRSLSRLGERAGIVRPGKPWLGERLKERLGRLRSTLQALEALHRKGDIDQYEEAAETFASDVRETWERAIEEGLFKGVVMRFQRDVKALKIKDVEVTPWHTQEIYDGMTETSPYHHEPSLAKPVPIPTPDELRQFFERLDRFCESLRSQKAHAQAKEAAGQPAA